MASNTVHTCCSNHSTSPCEASVQMRKEVDELKTLYFGLVAKAQQDAISNPEKYKEYIDSGLFAEMHEDIGKLTPGTKNRQGYFSLRTICVIIGVFLLGAAVATVAAVARSRLQLQA